MSAVDIKFYEKKKSQTFYISIVLLLLVILLTAGLYYYSYSQSKTIRENNSTLAQIETWILEIQQDEKVQIYSIYADNRNLFSVLAESSKIPTMINHLKRVFTLQDVSYKWFAYSDGKAQIELSLETDDDSYAYEKVSTFLENYRGNEEALFTIDQISNFSWYDRITFTVDLTLKTQ